jgi:hypothetical protein
LRLQGGLLPESRNEPGMTAHPPQGSARPLAEMPEILGTHIREFVVLPGPKWIRPGSVRLRTPPAGIRCETTHRRGDVISNDRLRRDPHSGRDTAAPSAPRFDGPLSSGGQSRIDSALTRPCESKSKASKSRCTPAGFSARIGTQPTRKSNAILCRV